MKEVTIVPIYDSAYKIHPSITNADGYLAAEEADFYELADAGDFMDTIRNSVSSGDLKLQPGYYLLTEYDDDIGENQGVVFTVEPGGRILQGIAMPSQPVRMTTWPPKP